VMKDKENMAPVHNGILFSYNKGWSTFKCNHMDRLGDTTLSVIRQAQKVQYHMISLRCGI
jgi:hypothetical protein